MFKKILIAEDQECLNLSVQKTLEDLNIPNVDYVYYCDDALAKIQKSIRENEPYDLLITDLYYEEDHRQQKLETERINSENKGNPAGSESDCFLRIQIRNHRFFFKDYHINGYVRKARNDSKELKNPSLPFLLMKIIFQQTLSRM
jgi:hypothetical protein